MNRSTEIVNRVSQTKGYRDLFNAEPAMVKGFGSLEAFLAHVASIDVRGEVFQPKGAEGLTHRTGQTERGQVQVYGGEEFRQKKAGETWKAYRAEYAEWKAARRAEWA